MNLMEFKEFANKGEEFEVTFTKRSTGELRTMRCKRGVTEGLKGVGQTYSPEEKGLFTVYDVEKSGYRNVDLKNIKSVKLGGVEYVWNEGTTTFEKV
ncbi:hypothetical protein FDI40_gp664 [Agrobacterium phage Atu_ph07]|uniref:Uncharacterized protein n=1 Tax=Agrobacterium phage Atu_ph07 TaxID=2024264 RepID=A0A2L0V0X6_9CAUD|nr:hypothetical protein FDI40_gp664 [Agrobacterium phage Atu_ph07]AUZ95421.1 hypothetical protein [Agrobacterium phage Atu_ph07]